MLMIIGLVIVFGSIIAGYLMHHGELAVLWQPNEVLIIGGCALGALIVGNPASTIKRSMAALVGLLKPSPFTHQAYEELLQVLYAVFQKSRKDGLVGLESHIEAPEKSDIFKKYPTFLANKHAVSTLCDTLKVLLTGAVENHHLADVLDMDLEQYHHEAMQVPNAITKVSDALPGFGIVAAVLGVIITMGSIGGSAALVGQKVAAALVGTFLGILGAYGVVGPMAQAIEGRVAQEHAYLLTIRTALLAFARGDAPMAAVEFARRSIEPLERPSFTKLEGLLRGKAA
jgi:chemotaxis protein MotA